MRERSEILKSKSEILHHHASHHHHHILHHGGGSLVGGGAPRFPADRLGRAVSVEVATTSGPAVTAAGSGPVTGPMTAVPSEGSIVVL
jgi:hypothetical protein